MKKKITESIEIPQGISCLISDSTLVCQKDSLQLSRKISVPTAKLLVEGNKIILECPAGNKNIYKQIKSNVAHVKNLFMGFQNKFIYNLESCNVHFPITLKIDSENLVITNFLGEKVARKARILPGVDVEIKGQKIIVSSNDKESAGQTAANIEKATKIKNRDRRIFQDGIFIVDRPGGAK